VDSSTLGSEHWSDDPPVRPRVRALTVLAASAGTLSVGCGGLALGAVVLAALTSLPGADSPEPAPPQGEVAPAAPQPVPAPVPAPADPAPELPRPVPSTGPAPAVESPRPRPAAPAPTEPAPSPPAVPVHVSSVPSAPLEIDDVARGNTPWDGELEPGEHWLVIREDGKLRLRRKIAIGPGPLVAYCWDLATEEPCSH
jgi:outer membrane biosynthesis protein TonB